VGSAKVKAKVKGTIKALTALLLLSNDSEFGYNGGMESFESRCDFGCPFEGKSRRIE